MKYLIYSLLLLPFMACESGPNEMTKDEPAEPAPPVALTAEALLAKTLEAHGGARYDTAAYRFVFRDRQYEFQNDGPRYRYQRSYQKDGSAYVDVLDNDGPRRTIDERDVELTEKAANSLTEGLNSVIYFATLPHKLLDPAVIRRLGQPTEIGGKSYDVLEIAFREEGGGTDHDDNFRYWINQDDHTIDFLAYDYRVDGGGVRFRKAYNRRVVDGIIFQDYVNYKAPVGTALDSLPTLYEADRLEELSRIDTESVESLLQ